MDDPARLLSDRDSPSGGLLHAAKRAASRFPDLFQNVEDVPWLKWDDNTREARCCGAGWFVMFLVDAGLDTTTWEWVRVRIRQCPDCTTVHWARETEPRPRGEYRGR